MKPTLELVTTYPPSSTLRTEQDGRCSNCGHTAGKPCCCSTCENHGKIHEYQHRASRKASKFSALTETELDRIWDAIESEDE